MRLKCENKNFKKAQQNIGMKISTKMQKCDMVDTYGEYILGHP